MERDLETGLKADLYTQWKMEPRLWICSLVRSLNKNNLQEFQDQETNDYYTIFADMYNLSI